MDAGRFRRVKDVLVEALAREGDARAAWLDEVCAGDPDLRREVEDLLARGAASRTLVDRGVAGARAVQALAGELAPAAADPEAIPARIGPYRITGVLGEGGMGVVYRGRQEEPIRREVAVKVLRRGLDTARVLERFAWERRTLARMDHPHIARILDAGSAADGRPWVALELVRGEPVTRWCADRSLPLDDRLDLMIRVCRAVQHAHDRGVLHRDLKPGNVLVREVDGRPTPSIIDFGIAKALEETDLELTMAGQVVGTPAYMSPEQRTGDQERIDVRSDVYALGVMLYELLAGVRPAGETGPDADRTPPPSRAAAAGDAPPVPWRRRLRGDLDRICLMAVRPEPERRYASAQALADDLERYREGRPVTATPDSWAYRARKTARRHPVLVSLGAAAAAFAVAGVAFLGYHADRLHHEQQRALAAEQLARQEEQAARGIAGFLEGLFTEIDPEQGRGGDVTARQLLDDGAARLRTELADQPAVRGRLLLVMGTAKHGLALHEESLALLDSALAAYAAAPDTGATVGDRAELRATRATVLYDLGRYAAAEADGRRALALVRRAGAASPAHEADVLADVATYVQAQSRVDEAADLLRASIRLGQAMGAEGRASVAWSRSNLGYMLYQQGRFAAAEEQIAAAVAIQRELYAGDDFELASSLNNLGGIELVLGRLDAAEAAFTEGLAMCRRIYGEAGHPAVARAMNQVARVRLERGDIAGAAALVEPAHAMNRRILGEDHVYTSLTMIGLARLRQAQGRAAAAESLLTAAVALRDTALGEGHRRTREARADLGRFLLQEGRDAEARDLLADLVAAEEERLPDEHPLLNRLRVDLAEAEARLGGRTAARDLAAAALPRLVAAYGGASDEAARARTLLAGAD